jgi:tetratricopeptide (TPR) repeat protein
MSLVDRFLTQKRVRTARAKLADEPSVANYLALASELARNEELPAAIKVCEEGLGLFHASEQLASMVSRLRQLSIEGRTRELTRELREAPRPALWREMCELQISAGRFDRAEEYALEWFTADKEPQALLLRARARAERFLVDRGREDGQAAWDLLDQCEGKLPEPEPHLRLRLKLACCVGAWGAAERSVAALLELLPGDPELEARYRALQAQAAGAPDFASALRTVEKSGLFADEGKQGEDPDESLPSSTTIRPMLQGLADESSVKAALYTKGATALVQGLTGATAERMARGVREVVQTSRMTARRLGLGQALEIQVEGSFGSLLVVPAEQGAGAIWRDGPVLEAHQRYMAGLVGRTATAGTRGQA